jgi:hypothetical protein
VTSIAILRACASGYKVPHSERLGGQGTRHKARDNRPDVKVLHSASGVKVLYGNDAGASPAYVETIQRHAYRNADLGRVERPRHS